MRRTQAGVVVGIVKSCDDPRGEGRIEVEFPWLEDGHRSGWAPIATPLAGGKRGAFFMPEPDDEVLCSFQHGSFDHPYIIGYLWNGADKPPEQDPKNRIILTPGGHTLRFEDGDEKKVILRTDAGHELVLDDAGKKISLKSKDGHELSLDDGGKKAALKSKGGHEVELDAGGKTVSVKSTTGHEVHLDDQAAEIRVSTPSGMSSLTLSESAGARLRGGGRMITLSNGQVAIA